MTTIHIHEFSTGINVKGNETSWHSNGFSGHYMNSTLVNVPEAVRQEIAAELFKLSEGAVQQTSALIGREVKLGNEEWSVLAVINSAWDESGRWIAVTRFFLAQGLGKLNDLVSYQKAKNLKFDPFDKKQLNQPNQYNTDSTKEIDILPIIFDDDSSILNNLVASPLILSAVLTNKNQKIPIKAIYQLAQEKSKISANKLITWACDVEGLKKPHDFLVIYSASPQADQYLQQFFQVKHQRIERREGEQQILTIVNNWIYHAEVQQNDIVIINNVLLKSNQYNDEFWNISIFQQLGIDDAILGTYTPHFIRLYLLYSLVFPNKFPEFLVWLNKKKDKQKEYLNIAINFSNVILKGCSQLPERDSIQFKLKVFQVLNYILPVTLLEKSELLDIILDWLKLDDKGIFGDLLLNYGYINQIDQDFQKMLENKLKTINDIKYSNQFKFANLSNQNICQNFEHYIKVMFKTDLFVKSSENLVILKDQSWQLIAKAVSKIMWLEINGEKFASEFKVLAAFFEKIDNNGIDNNGSNNRVSGLFYHLSQGEIPTSVWKKCQFDLDQTPTFGNLQAIKGLAASANKTTSITHSLPALPPASTSDELDSQDSQELTIEDKALLAVPIFWLKFLPFLRDYDELVLLLRSYSQETTPVTPPSPVTPNDQISPTTNQNTEYEAILYGIPVKRKLTLLEKLQRYFGKSFSLVFGLLFKSHQVPASGLILLALALLAGAAGYQVNNLQVSHCKSPNLASTVISKIPLIGVNCPEPPSPEELTVAALNKIVKDSKDYLKVNENESQATIIELLDSTGNGKIYHLNFQQIEPKGWLVFWRSSKIENLSNWTTAIKNYQLQAVEQQKQAKPKINKKLFLNPIGEIKQGDPTDQYLRCELQKNLQLPSNPDKIKDCQKYGVTGLTLESTDLPSDLLPSPFPTPSPNPSGSDEMGSADWQTTLDALRDEIANDYSSDKDKVKVSDKDKVKVEDAIIQALLLSASYKYKKEHEQLWIQGIKKFQDKFKDKIPNYSGDGFITKDDSTYNLLKCKVAKNLKITLKNPPAECSSNP
jgi:hypothetical protein